MLTVGNFTVNDLGLLDQRECKKVHSVIEDLKQFWIKRHPRVPFYTLGASHYFDIAYNPELPYYRIAKQYNSILWENLGWLYQKLADQLSKYLQAPVGYRQKLALPGFHIFQYHQAFQKLQSLTHQQWYSHRYDPNVVASPIHVDAPHWVVDWETEKDLDLSNPISFTMAIALPNSGGGMYVWDLCMNETIGVNRTELLELLAQRNKQLCSYKIGQVSLHSGLNYHQVAPLVNMQPDDARITLQGHGIFCQGSWQLYW